ncbi:Chemotaxis protein CheD [Candidatus Rhodobacter oscarellae]|uniref:Probable chemoreceptor glutamine deamidase CheD n=1 Tax=Candidatus Rhodobacter oscarellae TaxID=1675527 RepID=A0A0J9GRW5_9RHOB|nr:chemotaxis protein CheD [Candidatus Rhodobacter lobularis]KMW56218.1 Chemotaxis protein CheD [Candidatus Rhodobacter lobularis]
MERAKKIHVQIGQVHTGQPGDILTAILGSCVGVMFIHRDKNICGLAHCLLASKGDVTEKIGARHVDQAIVSLLSLMEVEDSERRRLQVVLCGGANMSLPADTDPKRLVGTTNAEFARKAIKAAGLRLTHEDLGGVLGRQVSIDCATREYTIATIPRLGTKE